MKQYIVLIATIALGVFLYGLIAGPGGNSLTHEAGRALLGAAQDSIGAGR